MMCKLQYTLAREQIKKEKCVNNHLGDVKKMDNDDTVYVISKERINQFMDEKIDEMINYLPSDLELNKYMIEKIAIGLLYDIVVSANNPKFGYDTINYLNNIIGDYNETMNYINNRACTFYSIGTIPEEYL